MSKVNKAYGIVVEILMNAEGISQKELARRMNVSLSYVSDVIRGAKNFSLKALISVASAFGIRGSQLFELVEKYEEYDDSKSTILKYQGIMLEALNLKLKNSGQISDLDNAIYKK